MCQKLQTGGTGTNHEEHTVFDGNSNCSFTEPGVKNCYVSTSVLIEKLKNVYFKEYRTDKQIGFDIIGFDIARHEIFLSPH